MYQIIMYIDLKEHHSCPFRVSRIVNIKDRAHLTEFDMNVTLGGMFSFRVCDPALFYRHICANAAGTVPVELVLPQMRLELASALGVGLAALCEDGAVSPTDISAHIGELSDAIAAAMTEKWTALRGFAVVSLAIGEVSIAPADQKMLQGVERDKVFTDPAMAAAHLIGAQGDALRTAAGNTAGSVGAFAAVSAASPNTQIAELYKDRKNTAQPK